MDTGPRSRLAGPSPRTPGFLGRLAAFAVGAALLVAALMVSAVVFAIALVGALVIGGYVWWKTRALRRQLRERPPGGHVIEGEAIRDDDVPPR
jgi:Flp pilus assembly protein TadB